MNIIKYRIGLFDSEPTSTEKNALKIFESKPMSADTTYFATSWNSIINQNIINSVDYKRIKGDSFTICDHISFERIIDKMVSIGIKVLFISHLTTEERARKITLKPMPQWPMRTDKPAEKTMLYSFIGFVSHPLRKTLLNMQHPTGCVIKERPSWYFEDRKHDANNQYVKALSNSRYSLCPVGSGPSTIRFWESLVAGAIPVLISDKIKLPEHDWENCIVRVPEGKVRDVPGIVSSISAEREKVLRDGCLRAAAKFTGDNFVSVIRDHYGNN